MLTACAVCGGNLKTPPKTLRLDRPTRPADGLVTAAIGEIGSGTAARPLPSPVEPNSPSLDCRARHRS
jgi:hypothetical protein